MSLCSDITTTSRTQTHRLFSSLVLTVLYIPISYLHHISEISVLHQSPLQCRQPFSSSAFPPLPTCTQVTQTPTTYFCKCWWHSQVLLLLALLSAFFSLLSTIKTHSQSHSFIQQTFMNDSLCRVGDEDIRKANGVERRCGGHTPQSTMQQPNAN